MSSLRGLMGLSLKFLVLLTAVTLVLMCVITFQYQSIHGSLTSSTNQSDDSNTTTVNLSSSSDNNQTKSLSSNSTVAITKSLQNTTKQNSTLPLSIPVQNTSNLVITRPDQDEQLTSSLQQQQLDADIGLPLLLPPAQQIQQPEIFSFPMYPQEPSVIQSQLLLQNVPFSSPSPSYSQEPSLIQLQQLLPNVLLTPPISYNTMPVLPMLPYYPPSYFIPSNPIFSPSLECQGLASCFRGIVTSITDGDTLDVSEIPIRLALIDTPEIGQSGYLEANAFVQSVCGVGSEALVDEDDGQIEGSFGRLISVVYCGGYNTSLNELLLQGGYAVIDQRFCGISEFSTTPWALQYGCVQQQDGCDPSYPDVCIPPYPPDLNCEDFPQYRNFRVLPPDPHQLDGDADGIGCET